MNGERASFSAEQTADGIRISGQGAYDSAEGSAAGLVWTKAVNVNSFTAELLVDQAAGLRSEGADHWFNFNLLNQLAFFSLDNPGKAEGLVVLMRPYDANQIEVETYLLTPGSGFMGLGAARIDWANRLTIEFKAGDGTLQVNGQPVEADFSKIPAGLFADGAAYFSTGASAQGDAKFSYTLVSVNGNAVASGDGASDASAPKASAAADPAASAAENPKTGDSGMSLYLTIAVVALAALIASATRSARKAV